MVTFCKGGGGMFSIWALRACSYKTKAEAYHQGSEPSILSKGFFWFLSYTKQRVQKVQEVQGGSKVQEFKKFKKLIRPIR